MGVERPEIKRAKLPPPLDPALRRLETAFERLGPLPRADIFSQPSGPHRDCFSAKKIVNMFFAGATKEELAHMAGCGLCSLKLSRYAQLTEQALPEMVTQGLLARVKGLFVPRQQARAAYCGALLHISEPVIGINPASDPTLDFSCDLVVGVEGDLPKIDGPSIQVSGPICATGATVGSTVLAGKKLLRVRFEKAHVAEYVRREVKKHASVSDTLVIRGHLEESSDLDFQGQATVEFTSK